MKTVRGCWLGWVGTLLLGCTHSGEPRVAAPAPAEVPSPFQVAVAPRSAAPSESETPQAPPPCPRFRDVHEEAKLEHVYLNGERGRCLLFETTGGGAGWLDYDGDGQWDLYLNQGGDATADSTAPQPNDKLFRNRGDGTFEDVTDQARIVELRYSQAVAIGDFDDDGFDDVYVTNLGRNTLCRNQGDGTFVDVTEAAGVGDPRWSASAAWADLDLDGDLDLYVCNYCDYDPKHPLEARSADGQPRIIHPNAVDPAPDECYFNLGDGTFAAEAAQRGMADPGGRGLGVAVADFNNDGLPDVFVTNDTTANFLFVNQGGGRFQESALLLGCALDADGNANANMGVAVVDFDHNGYLDAYITHFHEESDALYRNLGPEGFQEESVRLGLRALTFDRLSFGVVMADFNQDGLHEIVMASGHIENSPGYPFYHMSPLLLAWDGTRFRDASREAGEFFQGKYVGRAVAACDYDGDGDLDLAIAQENFPAALLRNESERGHWLKFFMRGRQSNRRGVNCRVTVQAGPVRYLQELCGGTSYAATHQPALVFGLGQWNARSTVTVRWPSGRVQTLKEVGVDRTLVLDEADAVSEPQPRR